MSDTQEEARPKRQRDRAAERERKKARMLETIREEVKQEAHEVNEVHEVKEEPDVRALVRAELESAVVERIADEKKETSLGPLVAAAVVAAGVALVAKKYPAVGEAIQDLLVPKNEPRPVMVRAGAPSAAPSGSSSGPGPSASS